MTAMQRESITSTRAPGPSFFRSQRSRRLSTSSSEESTSSHSSRSDSSSSSSDGDTYPTHPPLIPSSKRVAASSGAPVHHQRVSLLVPHIHQSLHLSSFHALSLALKQLSNSLPSNLASLASYIPILHRLARSLELELGSEEKSREWRKSLGREDAKALVGLRQRWATGGGKGKGREMGEAWVERVAELVRLNPPPEGVLDCEDKPTRSWLDALESLLLPFSLPRVSLARLGLTDEYVRNWSTARRAEEILDWYASFGDAGNGVRKGREVLDGVRSLDLSKNRLTNVPTYFHDLFPGLETLNLSTNQFLHLPPMMMLWHSMRRIRTHGNHLRKGRGKGRRGKGTRGNLKEILRILSLPPPSPSPPPSGSPPPSPTGPISLLNTCAIILRSSPLPLPPSLPPHLSQLLSESYTCTSCHLFISSLSSSSWIPSLFELVYHLDPGVSIPRFTSPHPPSSSDPLRTGSPPPHQLTLEEKVLLSLLSRGTDLAIYVMGDRESSRFCRECCRAHLGLEEEAEGRVGCGCRVCEEEARVREGKGEGIMRWLRRRNGRSTLGF